MAKKRECFCSGITRKDGSKILCTNCEHDRISKILEEQRPLTTAQIKKDFIEEEYIEQFGADDAEGTACKLCYTLFDNEKIALKHFNDEHNK